MTDLIDISRQEPDEFLIDDNSIQQKSIESFLVKIKESIYSNILGKEVEKEISNIINQLKQLDDFDFINSVIDKINNIIDDEILNNSIILKFENILLNINSKNVFSENKKNIIINFVEKFPILFLDFK